MTMTKAAVDRTEEDDPRSFSIRNDNDESRRWQKNFAARKKERNEQANKESVPPPHHHQQQEADTERLWSISNFRHHSKDLDNCNKLIDDYSRLETSKQPKEGKAEDITGTCIHTPFCCRQEEASNTTTAANSLHFFFDQESFWQIQAASASIIMTITKNAHMWQ